jgi:predicted outer membrane repeat protein
MARYAGILFALLVGAFTLGLAGAAERASAAPAAGVVGDGTPGSCTQAALDAALLGGGLVTFNCGGPHTIVLTSAKVISVPTTVSGGGVITLTGNLSTRLFVVDIGANLTLDGLTLYQGYSNMDGGAIYNQGTLTVLDSVFANNISTGGRGGAIFTDGPADIRNSTFRDNTANAGGGGVSAIGFNARVRIRDSYFSKNLAENGGAIFAEVGARLDFSGWLIDNIAARGGGIHVAPGGIVAVTARLDPDDSGPTFVVGNRGHQSGGGFYNDSGVLTIDGAELDSNSTLTDTVGTGYGGGIASVNAATLVLRDSTLYFNQGRFGGALLVGTELFGAGGSQAVIERSFIVQNRASASGGGLYTNDINTVVTITDSSLAANTSLGAGGGLSRFNSRVEIHRSSLVNNVAQNGGGMFVSAGPNGNEGGYVKVRDTTISGNTASSGNGGGVYNQALLELYSVTLKDNSGGLYNQTGSNGRLRNAVLQNNSANCQGSAPSDDAGNYATDTSCAFGTSQQGAGLNPMLGPQEFDADSRKTYHMPLAGSPLINTAHPACSPRDQLGALRHNACDIGAIESDGLLPRLFLPLVRR